jgi:hypothetical protein
MGLIEDLTLLENNQNYNDTLHYPCMVRLNVLDKKYIDHHHFQVCSGQENKL